MTILGQALRGVRTRPVADVGTLADPSPELVDSLTGGRTIAGVSVTPENSLALIPVFSAVQFLAGAVGSIPFNVYRRVEGGRELHRTHRCSKLIGLSPTAGMAADEFFSIVQMSLALWGNAFIAKGYDPLTGLVNELVPIKPSRVAVGRKDGRAIFTVDGKKRADGQFFNVRDILHIRGLSSDGVVGLSPIQVARQALANGMALDEFAGRFWQNNARPGVILQHPNNLSEEAAERLKKSWDAAHGGLANIAKTAVLEEGMTVETIGLPLDDAQFVDQMRFTDVRVAQLFRMPASLLLANPGTSLTYSTTEGEGISVVRWTLKPWTTRIAGALLADPDLFPEGGDRIYPEGDLRELQRADTKTEIDTTRGLVNDGIILPNEGRERLGWNPLDTTEYPEAGKLREPKTKPGETPADAPPEGAPDGGPTQQGGTGA